MSNLQLKEKTKEEVLDAITREKGCSQLMKSSQLGCMTTGGKNAPRRCSSRGRRTSSKMNEEGGKLRAEQAPSLHKLDFVRSKVNYSDTRRSLKRK